MLADSSVKAQIVCVSDSFRLAVARSAATLGGRAGVRGLVSVVIPTLEERAQLLATQALPSIARQTYQDFEVLVVSESFSETLGAHVESFGPRFKYFWGATKSAELRAAGPLAMWCSGGVPGLNFAHRRARGEYIARLDDDDEWLDIHLENAVRVISRGGVEFVSSLARSATGELLPLLRLSDPGFGAIYDWAGLDQTVGTPITWVYKRPVSAIPYNPSSWRKRINRPGDYDLMLRLAAAGVRFGFSPEVTARQLFRPGAAGKTGSSGFTEEHRTSD